MFSLAVVFCHQHLLNALSYKRAEIRVGNGFVFRPNRCSGRPTFPDSRYRLRAAVLRASHVLVILFTGSISTVRVVAHDVSKGSKGR